MPMEKVVFYQPRGSTQQSEFAGPEPVTIYFWQEHTSPSSATSLQNLAISETGCIHDDMLQKACVINKILHCNV